MFPQQGPCGERCSISRVNGFFFHLYLLESPIKESSHEMGENIWSPSMELHADGRPKYNGVQPGSPVTYSQHSNKQRTVNVTFNNPLI